jgi:hypothetical protein
MQGWNLGIATGKTADGHAAQRLTGGLLGQYQYLW